MNENKFLAINVLISYLFNNKNHTFFRRAKFSLIINKELETVRETKPKKQKADYRLPRGGGRGYGKLLLDGCGVSFLGDEMF